MNYKSAVNIDDLRKLAKRRLPKIIFDYVEGGLEDELALLRNEASFQKHRLLPRYLVDVSKRDQTRSLFGRVYSSPFGISPTGNNGLSRRGADLMLAAAAAEANIPYVLSAAGNTTIEEIVKIAPGHTWYQVYAANNREVTDAMIGRARDVGVGALVLTVDVPITSKREREIRNGYSTIRKGGISEVLKLKPSILLDVLTHPAWCLEYLKHRGAPMLANWAAYAPPGSSVTKVNAFGRSQMPAGSQTWHDLERYRRLFPGPIVVKGILRPRDAVHAVEAGANGIIVSNHGGRQLDQSPTSLEALPAIKSAVAGRAAVMLDSGIRRGADILIALCLGADFVFLGRATLYGAAAAGLPGVKKAIDILRKEIDVVMAQMGCPILAEINADYLWREDGK